jgi:hypothetical protein
LHLAAGSDISKGIAERLDMIGWFGVSEVLMPA